MCIFITLMIGISAAAYLRLIPAYIARFPSYDKIGHFMIFGLAGYIAHRAFDRSSLHIFKCNIPLGPLAMACFAFIEEALQVLSPNRTVSFTDLGVGLAGIICFYLADFLLQKIQQKKAASKV